MPALKVFGIDLHPASLAAVDPAARDGGGQRRCYVAATSRSAAAAALGISTYYLGAHGYDIDARDHPAYQFVLAEPGQVFVKLGDLSGPLEAKFVRARCRDGGPLRCWGKPFQPGPGKPRLVIVLEIDVPWGEGGALPEEPAQDVADEVLAHEPDSDIVEVRQYAGCPTRFITASWVNRFEGDEILARL